MPRIKKLKVKDGTGLDGFSGYIDIGADAKNIDVDDQGTKLSDRLVELNNNKPIILSFSIEPNQWIDTGDSDYPYSYSFIDEGITDTMWPEVYESPIDFISQRKFETLMGSLIVHVKEKPAAVYSGMVKLVEARQ